MRKQAICVQCHNKPELVNFLVDCMPSDIFDFYIHVDKKSDMFDDIVKKPNVFFADRVDVQWGRFSQIQATLNMFRMIDTVKYSYVHLVSGNCFITKNPLDIARFFDNCDLEYIDSDLIGGKNNGVTWRGMDRVECYYPQCIIKRPRYKLCRFFRLSWREFVMRIGLFKRKNKPVKDFYLGSQWFSITAGALKWMLDYVDEHKEYVNFFKHGLCSDEVFFQTLIRYSPYADRVANCNKRFLKWQGSNTGGPCELSEKDFDDILKSDCYWTRKITDLSVAEKIYENVNCEGI